MKTLKLTLLGIIFLSSFGSANAANTAYSLEANCNRINGKSWRVCGNVYVSWEGKVWSNIRTSSNRWQGFTGAMVIVFKDANKKPIYEIVTPSYGVNGESSRVTYWETQIDDWVIEHSQYISARGIHTSTNRTLKFVYNTAKKYIGSDEFNRITE